MPEITTIHVVLVFCALLLGLVAGWTLRARRGASEKAAISAGWQEQFEAQRSEHERLVEQNQSLMEQNSQYQASNKDVRQRANELAATLKVAVERRDELQCQVKDTRRNLEAALAEQESLHGDMRQRAAEVDVTAIALKARDERIKRLTRDLKGWQDRVPPLIDRFRTRNAEAGRLELQLRDAQERVAALEGMVGSDQTRVEPLDRDALGEDLNASNEPMDFADSSAADYADPLAGAVAEPENVVAEDTADIGPGTDLEAPANGHDRDNLKRIKGVGPAIEKTLNELGIRRLEQVATLSEYDIDRIAQRLKGMRTRIYREDWMGQARHLLEQRAGRSS